MKIVDTMSAAIAARWPLGWHASLGWVCRVTGGAARCGAAAAAAARSNFKFSRQPRAQMALRARKNCANVFAISDLHSLLFSLRSFVPPPHLTRSPHSHPLHTTPPPAARAHPVIPLLHYSVCVCGRAFLASQIAASRLRISRGARNSDGLPGAPSQLVHGPSRATRSHPATLVRAPKGGSPVANRRRRSPPSSHHIGAGLLFFWEGGSALCRPNGRSAKYGRANF